MLVYVIDIIPRAGHGGVYQLDFP